MDVRHREVEAGLSIRILELALRHVDSVGVESPLLLQDLFFLFSDHLGDLVLPDVNVGLDTHRKVDPLVDVEHYSQGKPERTDRLKHSCATAVEGRPRVQVADIVALVREEDREACIRANMVTEARV